MAMCGGEEEIRAGGRHAAEGRSYGSDAGVGDKKGGGVRADSSFSGAGLTLRG